LGTNLSAEGIHFLDDEFLHALDGVFFFESEIEFLSVLIYIKKLTGSGWGVILTASHTGSSAGSCHT
jgi:hypothetical protein